MTVQQILSLDSTADIRVGVAKLQQILNTLRLYKNKAEELEHEVVISNTMISEAVEEIKQLEVAKSVLELREDSLAISNAKKAKRIEELEFDARIYQAQISEMEKELKQLKNTKMKIGAIDIDLGDL